MTMDYLANHVKRNPATGEVAIRTIFPASDDPGRAMMEWLIASPVRGARNTSTAEVENWDDIFVPAELSGNRTVPGNPESEPAPS